MEDWTFMIYTYPYPLSLYLYLVRVNSFTNITLLTLFWDYWRRVFSHRYLCEYTYYTSLSIDNTRTLFVHVPDTQIYSSEQTARGLERIVELCLEQLNENDTMNLTDDMKKASLNSQTTDGDGCPCQPVSSQQ